MMDSDAPADAGLPALSVAAGIGLVGTLLSACGSGGGTGGLPASSGGTTPTPTPVAKTTAVQASRFLQQAQFSASDADIADVQAQGYATWLDAQLTAPATQTAWDWLVSRGFNDTTYINTTFPSDDMVWYQLLASTDAVRKRVTLALSEIMVVSVLGVPVQWRFFAMAGWWDTLAANALGNFRALLEAVTLNPAMGVYLNTRGNQKEDLATGRQPDENYAREVLQLFTIGLYELNPDGSHRLGNNGLPIETYVQSEVSQLARVFTGYNFNLIGATPTNPQHLNQPMVLNAARHAAQPASFLGTTVAANTPGATALQIALDAIFNHANVGPFFGKQLIQRLVTSNPSPAYVARVTAAFNNNGSGVRGDLKAVLRAVLLDSEARGDSGLARADFGKIREPVIRLVQWARTFGATSASGAWKLGDLSSDASRLGQSPLRAASVFNFFRPGFVPPNTALATTGLVAPELQISSEVSVAGYINFMQSTIRNGVADVVAAYTRELALGGDVTALVDRLNLLLTAGQLSAATIASIRTVLSSLSAATAAAQLIRVQAGVLLVMTSPEYLVQK
jgi:uncharacterized protein (DUF1800 family)